MHRNVGVQKEMNRSL